MILTCSYIIKKMLIFILTFPNFTLVIQLIHITSNKYQICFLSISKDKIILHSLIQNKNKLKLKNILFI